MLVAISLVPFFLVDVPAVLDYPNHLARIFVLAHPADPVLSRFYAPHWRVLPNLGFDILGVLALKIFPVHVGGRILLAASMLAPLLGVFAYSRAAFGKPAPWSAAVMLTAFNGVFFLGFMNFLLAIGLAFAAAGVWLMLRREGRDGSCLLFGAVASAVLFLCHIFGVALFALLIGCQELSHRNAARAAGHAPRAVRGAVLIAVALLPAVLLYLASPLSDQDAGFGDWEAKHKVWNLFAAFMTADKLLTLVTGLFVFGVLIWNWRRAILAPGTGLALAVLTIAAFVLPDHLKGGTFVDIRLTLMMGLLLCAGMELRLPARQEWRMVLAIAALAGLRSVSVGSNWLHHREDLADLRAAIAAVEPGAKVLAAKDANPVTDPSAPERLLPDIQRLDSHLPALLLIERRAFWPQLFADPSQQPLEVRAAYKSIAQPSGEPVAWEKLRQDFPAGYGADESYLRHWRKDFEYVLLIDRPPSLRPPPGLIPVYIGAYAALWRVAR